MALKKKYQTIEELLVYPSLEPTIEVIPDDGAHRYRAQMCAGFVNGKTKYVDATDTIQFVHKHEDGTVTPGWPGILELAETEEELLDYLKDVSEFTRDEKGNN